MVQGTQELPVNHYWLGRSYPHICAQGVFSTRLRHRFATQLRLQTVVH